MGTSSCTGCEPVEFFPLPSAGAHVDPLSFWKIPKLNSLQNIIQLVMAAMDDFEVVPVVVRSLAWMKAKGAQRDDCVVCFQTIGEHVPMLQYIAREGFPHLEDGFLKDLGAHLNIHFDPEGSGPDLVQEIVKGVLPDIGNFEMMSIMEGRAKHVGGTGGCLDDGFSLAKDSEVVLAMPQREQEEVFKLIERQDRLRDEQMKFKEKAASIGELLEDTTDVDTVLGLKAKKTRELAVKRAISRRYPMQAGRTLGLDRMPSEEHGQEVAPPLVYLYRDNQCKRWLLCSKWGTRSRSWALWGFKAALICVLRWAWLQSLSSRKLSPLECPVKNIWPEQFQRVGKPKRDQDSIRQMIIMTIP